jgi:hypothetical protein
MCCRWHGSCSCMLTLLNGSGDVHEPDGLSAWLQVGFPPTLPHHFSGNGMRKVVQQVSGSSACRVSAAMGCTALPAAHCSWMQLQHSIFGAQLQQGLEPSCFCPPAGVGSSINGLKTSASLHYDTSKWCMTRSGLILPRYPDASSPQRSDCEPTTCCHGEALLRTCCSAGGSATHLTASDCCQRCTTAGARGGFPAGGAQWAALRLPRGGFRGRGH